MSNALSPRIGDRRTWTIIAILLVALVIFTGFVFQALRMQRLRSDLTQVEAQLARTRSQRDLARVHGKLGLVLYEVNRNNFANASARSTEFFDGLGAALRTEPLSNRPELQAVLHRRDEISADLARADPAVRPKLTELFLQLDRALAW